MKAEKSDSFPRYGMPWEEYELILTYYYYCKLPFGKASSKSKEVIQIAKLLGRSAGSVSYKVGNFASCDPKMKERGIKGLRNAGKADLEIANTFSNDWEGLVKKAKEVEEKLLQEKNVTPKPELMPDYTNLPEGKTKEQLINIRINQNFFRSAVLSSYRNACCITGLKQPSLLIASHIKPWKVSDPKTERTNPGNGLCLNAFHDRAFDQGLITVTRDYTIHVSSTLQKQKDNEAVQWMMKYDKQQIILPEKFTPVKDFLEYHNDVVFIP